MSETRYTTNEIQHMKLDALADDLIGPALFFAGEPEMLTQICNGCGSDGMPKVAVDALTLLFEGYAATVAIHDCRYWESDGTDDKRCDADDEFFENARKQWANRWGTFRWLKKTAWIDFLKIRTAYNMLRLFSGSAWADAFRKKEAREALKNDHV